jgi:hypothetical protein
MLNLFACEESDTWEILEEKISSQIRLNNYAGYGSVDTRIMRFSGLIENFGNCFSENHSSGYNSNTEGLEITINKTGKYSVMFSSRGDISSSFGLSLNSSELTTNIFSINAADRLLYTNASNAVNTMNKELLRFKKGDIIRAHASAQVPTTYILSVFSLSYIHG